MIINLLLQLVYRLLSVLLIFEIPQLPDTVTEYITSLFDYLVSGASILANYTPLGYLLTLFGIIVSIDVGIGIYRFVMWILKKIPMISVS